MMISVEQALAAIDTSFFVITSLGTVEFRLYSVHVPPTQNNRHNSMVLVFSAPATPQLAQDNYNIDHPSWGRRYLMIVPLIPPAEAPRQINGHPLMYYQIIFN